MTTITTDTPGWVYVLCFDRPLGNTENPRGMARHYAGWATDLPARIAEHQAGCGAAITRAAVERGISWRIFCWPGTLRLEHWLKQRKATHTFCPRCAAAAGRAPRSLIDVEQLALPIVDADFDFPPPPWFDRADWFEIVTRRQWSQARPSTGGGELDYDVLPDDAPGGDCPDHGPYGEECPDCRGGVTC